MISLFLSLFLRKYIRYEKFSHLTVEVIIFFWNFHFEYVDEVSRVRYLSLDLDIDRRIFSDLPFYDHEHISDLRRISYRFFKRHFIDIEIESSSTEILEILSIECAIGYIDHLPFYTHDLGIVEGDLFYDSLDSLDPYGISDLEGFTQYDRETTKEISDDIFACEGEYGASYPCSCEESTGIDREALEYEKSSYDPYDEKYDELHCGHELAHEEMIACESILDLTQRHTHEIRYYGSHEEATYDPIGIIYDSPCAWIEPEYIRPCDEVIYDHREAQEYHPREEIPEICDACTRRYHREMRNSRVRIAYFIFLCKNVIESTR